MTQPNPVIPAGHAGLLSPEFAVRRVLFDGLLELAADEYKLQQVFERADEWRLHGDGDDWTEGYKRAFQAMTQGDELALRIGLSFPAEDVPMPYLSVTADGGSEDESGAAMGDILDQGWRPTGETAADEDGVERSPDSRRYLTRGIAYNSRVDVGCWSTSIPQAILLQSTVRLVLMLRRPWLSRYGVQRVRMSDSALRADPTLNPRISVVPIIQLGIDWTLRIAERSAPQATQVRMGTGHYGETS